MTILLVSFLAGILTILAPCVLPVLPVVLGGSVTGGKRDIRPALLITASLAVSIVLFTLLLKFSAAFVPVSPRFWTSLSGGLLLLLGLAMVFPSLWGRFASAICLSTGSEHLLAKEAERKLGWGRNVLIGAALGPVFSSCSPTYFFILATVLPQRLAVGIFSLLAYALGLSLMLLLVAFLGQRIVARTRWATNPRGWFKKSVGILFAIIGIAILTGLDKQAQTFLIEKNIFYRGQLENRFFSEPL